MVIDHVNIYRLNRFSDTFFEARPRAIENTKIYYRCTMYVAFSMQKFCIVDYSNYFYL